MAYAEGPGGPVNTLAISQSVVQTILDLFIGQKLGKWGLVGLIMSIVGIFILSMGNMIIRKCCMKRKDNEPIGIMFSPKPRAA